jgi:dTDP-4-dehydrorhamnose 3,5-epimerase
MKIIKTNFKGLFLIKRVNYLDKRGNLSVNFNKKIINKNFIYDIYSSSNKNVIRGLHYQFKNQQEKFITVLNGKIFDVSLDLRKKSKTFGKFFSIILSKDNNISIFIPKGFAHGYCTLENNSIVYYKNSQLYFEKEQSGILWNDSILKIKWPIKKPTISKKDLGNLNFADFLKIYKYL